MIKWGKNGYFTFVDGVDEKDKIVYLAGNRDIKKGAWYLVYFGKNGMGLCKSVSGEVFDTYRTQLKIVGVDDID